MLIKMRRKSSYFLATLAYPHVVTWAWTWATTTTTHYLLTTATTTAVISSPGLRRGHVKKNAFHVKGVGEIVNQTVKSDRAIAPLLKTNNSTEGRQVEIS